MSFDALHGATAGSLITTIDAIVAHTRPTTAAELLLALNFGVGKLLRAAESVRPQLFVSFIDTFGIVAGQAEYDLSQYSPQVRRPVKLVVPGTSGPTVLFRYRSMGDPEFEAQEGSGVGAPGVFLYDVLTGLLPRTPIRYLSNVGAAITMVAGGGASFSRGLTVLFPNGGAVTESTLNQDHVTVVTGVAGDVVTVAAAPVATSVNVGGYGSVAAPALVPMWRRMLQLSPTPATGYTGRLYYTHRPYPILATSEILAPLITDHRDLVIAYAVSFLSRNVNDAAASDHKAEGDELRAELMQNLDPLAGMASEAVGSGLPGD